MDRLEADLRDELARRVTAPPFLPGLAETTVRRGRRARRRRTALVAGAGAAAVALALSTTSLLPTLPDGRPSIATAPMDGPPRVPVYLPERGELLDWDTGAQRTRQLGEGSTPVAQLRGGLLLVTADRRLALLGPDDVEPAVLLSGLASSGVAVSDDGTRATVAVAAGQWVQLREVALPSGRQLRALAPLDALVTPAAYSGEAVLVTLREGDAQRVRLWESGDDAVLGIVDGVLAAVGGADADFSRDRDALGGRAAFSVRDDRCPTEVTELRNGPGSRWELCQEQFVGFSPGGSFVLGIGAADARLVVHDADGGDVERRFDVPTGVRAAGWESEDSLLYATVGAGRTVIVRCSVQRDACVEAAALPDSSRVPVLVRAIAP